MSSHHLPNYGLNQKQQSNFIDIFSLTIVIYGGYIFFGYGFVSNQRSRFKFGLVQAH